MERDGHMDAGIRTSLREFLSSSLLPVSSVSSFEDDDSFLEKGILDSTGVLELVGYIENKFAIRVEADEIIPDNLDSIQRLVAFIGTKTSKVSS